MTTSPEHEQVISPPYTVGQWSKGAPSSGPTTKPIFINEGDAELGFTVPVRKFVIDPDYTVPHIEIEGGVICTITDPWTDTETWDDTCFWVDDGVELVTDGGVPVLDGGDIVIDGGA